MELEDLANSMKELEVEEDIEFYAHLTERKNGLSINEKGLEMDDGKLSSAANPIDERFYSEPEYYVDYCLGSPQTRKKDLMVIIASYKDEINSLVKNNSKGSYYIPSENIVGYVDIKDKYFVSNPNSDYSMDSYTL